MEQNLRVVILGGTGAVGSEVCAALLKDHRIASVTLLVRREIPNPHATKLSIQIVDVMSPASYMAHLNNHDIAICTFGVGQPTKTPRDEFQRIDHDAVLAFATACRQANIQHFQLLGSVAADPHSRSVYLQSKGRLRDAIVALGFARFSCFQPSMLITDTNRYDAVQGLMLKVWPVLSHFLVGPLKKYRSIHVRDLGRSMAFNVFTRKTGYEILQWPDFAVR
jgi:uncharacterized protein YbjT (DUF2867 family)